MRTPMGEVGVGEAERGWILVQLFSKPFLGTRLKRKGVSRFTTAHSIRTATANEMAGV